MARYFTLYKDIEEVLKKGEAETLEYRFSSEDVARTARAAIYKHIERKELEKAHFHITVKEALLTIHISSEEAFMVTQPSYMRIGVKQEKDTLTEAEKMAAGAKMLEERLARKEGIK